jgi:pimeloyl-ACP methyl ester carboxylesterase
MAYEPPLEVRPYQARTRDGWTLALHRYRVQTLAPRRRLPVVLCHGLGSNRHSFDVPRGPSLARFLAGHGYDVWSLELRGAGGSARPGLLNSLRWEWTFQHYVRFDAPAGLSLVRDVTGAAEVHWVGHSLGGMVAYALLAGTGAPIASAATLAAPAITVHKLPEIPGAKVFQAVLARLSRVPAGMSARLGAPLTGLAYRLSLFRVLYNPDNMDPAVIRRLLSCALDDVPARLLLEYLTAAFPHGNGAAGEAFAYEKRLGEVSAPLLLLGGAIDRICPPANLRAVHDRVGSEVKRLRILGRDTGCQHDYGHHDLLIGKNAPAEVYAHVAAWLDEQDSG